MFEGEPLELIGGELVVAEPQYPYHSSAVSAAGYVLRAVLPQGWMVRLRAPVSLDDESEPEPDRKGSLYARAGIEDYWIVNLVDRVLEVYRDPAPDPSARHGWGYRSVTTLAPPARVAPLAFASIEVSVADLLP
jgi:hypothetical protein